MVDSRCCVFVLLAFSVSVVCFGQGSPEGIAREKSTNVESVTASAREYSRAEGPGNMGAQTFADIRFAQRFAEGSSTGGIQEAIDNVCALEPSGGTVVLPLGTTTITAALKVPCDFLKIVGHGFATRIDSASTDIFVFPPSKVMNGLVFRDFAARTTGAGKSVFNLGSASLFLCEFDTLRLTANGGNGSSAILEPPTASIGLCNFQNIWAFTSVNNTATGLLHFAPRTRAYLNGNVFRNIGVDETGVTAGVPAIQIAVTGAGVAQGNSFEGISGEVCNFGIFRISGVAANGALADTVFANVWNGDRAGPNVGGEGKSTAPSIQIGANAFDTDLRNIGLFGYVGSPGIWIDPAAVGTKVWNSGLPGDSEVEIGTANPARVGEIIRLRESQTADAFQVVKSDGTVLFRIQANGNLSGFKHKRVSTGAIPANSDAAVTVSWTSGFSDANYTAACTVLDIMASGSSLNVVHLESVEPASIVVRVRNEGGRPRTGTLNCIAMHD